MLRSFAILTAFITLALPCAVRAEALDFAFQASTNPSSSFDFRLDSAPMPNEKDGIETIFELKGLENGTSKNYEVRFFNIDVSGGLSVDYPSNQNLNFTGAQIYGGSESNPTFTAGLYPLFYAPNYNAPDFDFGAPPVFAGNLVVSAVSSVSAAPEPGTWALMFVGVAILGAMLRLGRRNHPALAA